MCLRALQNTDCCFMPDKYKCKDQTNEKDFCGFQTKYDALHFWQRDTKLELLSQLSNDEEDVFNKKRESKKL